MDDRCEWPLTYGNCPTYQRDGITYLDTDAAIVLARRLIAEEADLMEALKDR